MPAFLIAALIMSLPLAASSVVWTAQSPNNDMNLAANWSPNTVPGSGDIAVFDSTISNIDMAPTELNADFLVGAFLFSSEASPFAITITNHALSFSGVGIVGANTDATINAINRDDPSFFATQVAFNGIGGASLGSAILNISNMAAQTASASSSNLGIVTHQIDAVAPLSIGSNARLTIINGGEDDSSGAGGNQTALIGSHQAHIADSVVVGDDAAISIFNGGTLRGSNSSAGNNVGRILGGQFINDGTFQAGDNLSVWVENSGTNSGTGAGNNFVGTTLSAQADFIDSVTIGDSGTLFVANEATHNSDGLAQDFTGYIIDQQLHVGGQFQAGDNLNVTTINLGRDESVGPGGAITGLIDSFSGMTGSQMAFDGSVAVGNNAVVTVENVGFCSGTKTVQGVNIAGMNKDQVRFTGAFQAGDYLNLSVLNEGIDTSQGVGSNAVGTVSDLQLGFDASCVLGDNAAISVSNSGSFTGSNSNTFNYSGSLGGKQFQVGGDFNAGDSFHLQVTSSGVLTATGVGDDFIGKHAGQAYFLGACTLGNGASISISNNGVNSSTSLGNNVAFSIGSQLLVAGDFNVGENLVLSVSNSATNTGDVNNNIALVTAPQAEFQQALNIGANALLSISNTGTVGDDQLVLNQGFNIAKGKATIQVSNQGTVGGAGISIGGNNAGGNANIVLENTSLVVDTNGADFTIGELNGDNTSSAQSHRPLIIDTDSSANADFSGVIQDFPAIISSLTKKGRGSQRLSGTNTYTGLTSILGGTLSISGSIVGDVVVHPKAKLKGAGSIGGTVTVDNYGALSPGNSIGTITLGNLALHRAATTMIEVNPDAASSINVAGTASIDGTLNVKLDPGAYHRRQEYLILSANHIEGRFSSVNKIRGLRLKLSYSETAIYLTVY